MIKSSLFNVKKMEDFDLFFFKVGGGIGRNLGGGGGAKVD